ncbi:zinc-ribbon domain-containing protein [Natronobacterium lacisalsi]
MPYCPNCGDQVKDIHHYCGSCGQALSDIGTCLPRSLNSRFSVSP